MTVVGRFKKRISSSVKPLSWHYSLVKFFFFFLLSDHQTIGMTTNLLAEAKFMQVSKRPELEQVKFCGVL